MNIKITSIYCSSEIPRCQNAKDRRKVDLFIPRPVHRSDDLRTEGRARNSIKRGGKGKKKRRKEGKKRNSRLKKLVLPVTQNRDAAVGRAVRPEIRVARLLRQKPAEKSMRATSCRSRPRRAHARNRVALH